MHLADSAEAIQRKRLLGDLIAKVGQGILCKLYYILDLLHITHMTYYTYDILHIWHITYYILHIWHMTYYILHIWYDIWHITHMTYDIWHMTCDILHILHITYHICETYWIWRASGIQRKRCDCSVTSSILLVENVIVHVACYM